MQRVKMERAPWQRLLENYNDTLRKGQHKMSMPQGAEARKSVEVVELKPILNKGNLRAFASIRLGGIIIHDCRIIQQFGQKAWVALPQKEYLTKAGEKKYAPVAEANDNLRKEINDAILAAWQREG